jgi:hypothetical protein
VRRVNTSLSKNHSNQPTLAAGHQSDRPHTLKLSSTKSCDWRERGSKCEAQGAPLHFHTVSASLKADAALRRHAYSRERQPATSLFQTPDRANMISLHLKLPARKPFKKRPSTGLYKQV